MFLDFTVLNITFDMGAITEALIRKGVLIGRRVLNQIDTNSIPTIIKQSTNHLTPYCPGYCCL